MTLALRCEDLAVGWPENVLIEKLALDAAFESLNCVLPIIGRTGFGKSTLLYAISGMARPKEGQIEWHFPTDPVLADWSAEKRSFKIAQQLRRRRFGFLLQDASMIPCFTIAENLQHILRLRGISDRIESRVETAIECMLIKPRERIERFIGQYPIKLSGGQRQRMALAAAIVHDPIVLFADEPTASLDDESGLEVLGAIRRWLDDAEGQRAFVFVTHRLETLRHGIGARQALKLYEQPVTKKIVATWSPVRPD
jgi:putative ABC transport system ATP-binding protein